jgi:hypothetical protein
VRAWWRALRAELAYLIGVTWLNGRMAGLSPEEVHARLDELEARRDAARGGDTI